MDVDMRTQTDTKAARVMKAMATNGKGSTKAEKTQHEAKNKGFRRKHCAYAGPTARKDPMVLLLMPHKVPFRFWRPV